MTPKCRAEWIAGNPFQRVQSEAKPRNGHSSVSSDVAFNCSAKSKPCLGLRYPAPPYQWENATCLTWNFALKNKKKNSSGSQTLISLALASVVPPRCDFSQRLGPWPVFWQHHKYTKCNLYNKSITGIRPCGVKSQCWGNSLSKKGKKVFG